MGGLLTLGWSRGSPKLRAHDRQPAEELEQWKTGVKEPKPLDASPAAINLAMIRLGKAPVQS